MGFGATELIIILVIVLVVFGAGKLTSVMGDLGKGVKSFKDGMDDSKSKKTVKKPAATKKLSAKASVKKSAVKKKTTAKKASTKKAAPKKKTVKKAPVKKAVKK